jgi:hypothetical protein
MGNSLMIGTIEMQSLFFANDTPIMRQMHYAAIQYAQYLPCPLIWHQSGMRSRRTF